MDVRQHRNLEWLRHLSAHTNQLAEATQAFEHAALKALFILNGGAAIAILAVVGTEAANRLDIGLALIGLAAWALGLIFAGTASWLMYFSQLDFYRASSQELLATRRRDELKQQLAQDCDAAHENYSKDAQHHRRCANWLAGASLVAFAIGVFYVVVAFHDVLKNTTG